MNITYLAPADDFGASNQFILNTEPPPSYAESIRRAKRSRNRARIPGSDTAPVPGRNGVNPVMTERSPLLKNGAPSEERTQSVELTLSKKLKEYFRQLGRREYWLPVLHLLILNFPFALVAWLYLFLGVFIGTTLLLTLPLGESPLSDLDK